MRKSIYLGALLLLVGCGDEVSSMEANAESTISALQDNSSTPLRNVNPIYLRHDQGLLAKSVGEKFQIVLAQSDSVGVWEISKAERGIQIMGDSVSGALHAFNFKALTRGVHPIVLSLRKNGVPVGSTFEVHIYVE